MRAHIRKPLSARHSRKKRLLTLLTSRLFIIVVLILLQLFVLLFAPCLVTVVAIRQESGSCGWPVFSMVFNTLIAFGAAVAVRHAAMLFL